MKFDFHIHTAYCGHATGSMEEYVDAAIRLGCSAIGFADHLPMLFRDDRSLSMAVDDLPVYVESVLDLQKRYKGDISILLGIEADYHPPTMGQCMKMINDHPFDYVIGSVHILGDWIIDDPREMDRYSEINLDDLYVEYFKAEEQMVETGLFNVVSHPDLIKKFNLRASIDLKPLYSSLLEKIKKMGMCYEVNTAGLRWQVEEMYPDPDFVRIGAEMGVPVTYGSDAHCPADVGRDFESAFTIIQSSGYQEYASFAGRKMRMAPLPDYKQP